MNWNFSIQGNPSNGNFVASLYDPSNPSSYPLSPVFQQAITSGFPGPFSVTATGLQAIVYDFVLWDTAGTTPSGLVRNAFSLQPTIQTLQVRADLYLTTDASPGLYSTSPTYVDPTTSLAGWAYDLEQIGYGTLQVGVGNDYTINGTTGNWTLLAGNPNTGQKFCIHFLPIVSNQPISVATPMVVSSMRIITTATATLTNTDMGTLIVISGAQAAVTITLPAIASVSLYESIIFSSAAGLHINAVIQAAGTDQFFWLQYSNQSTPQQQMILGQSEQLQIIKGLNGAWYVLQASDGIKNVGELVFGYNLFPINTIQAAGQLLLRASYPRLWNYVQKLSSSCIVSEAAWGSSSNFDGVAYQTNYGKYTYGDGSTTFRIPLLYAPINSAGTGFIRMIDGVNRPPSSFQIDTQAAHQHTRPLGTLPTPDNPYGNGPTTNVGRYNGLQVSASDLSSQPGLVLGGLFTSASKTAFENRPVNIGVYGLIRI